MLGEDPGEDHTESTRGWPLGAERDPWLTASKRIRTLVLQIQLNCASDHMSLDKDPGLQTGT